MQAARVFALAVILVTANHVLHAQDDVAKTYTIEFRGEDGKPLPHAKFYLYDMTGGQFKEALFRHHELGPDAKIELKEIPEAFTLGVVDRENFYKQFWYAGQIKLVPGQNSIRVAKTGVVSIEFGFIDPKIANPLVVPYYRRGANGQYEQVSGIGILSRPANRSKLTDSIRATTSSNSRKTTKRQTSIGKLPTS
jgi:hypothetical protein